MTEIVVNPLLAWILVLPLTGSFINGLFGKRLPKPLVSFIACGSIFASAIMAMMLLSVVMQSHQRVVLDLGPWISAGDLTIAARLSVDQLSAVMICVITGIGFLIHLYSTEYMADDPAYSRYFSYLNLFIFAMSMLVLGDNLVLMFVGWEGVGLCSYLLIGFWFDDDAKAAAGMKAFIVNRIGDFGVILGVLVLIVATKTTEFGQLKQGLMLLSPGAQVSVATIAGLLLFLGATGKSAQIPLYVWLPDAMAGPTPVSALIHAATMVTAGIYMICRLHFLYALAPLALATIAIVGACTAFFAATMGLLQTDIKKVLAYSTVSQLGYMFLGVGVGAYSAGFFHVFTHAFFKACLFLGAGAVIHALHHEQDIRQMGGLWKKLPITCATFVISTLAIMGFPGTSGFFSKDEIMWQAFASGTGDYASTFVGLNYVLFGLAWITACLTSFYMWRVTFLTFFSGKFRGDRHVYEHAHETPYMSLALFVLAFGAAVSGYLNVPELFGGKMRLSEFLYPSVEGFSMATEEQQALQPGSQWALMGLTLLGVLAAFAWAYRCYGKGIKPAQEKTLRTLPGVGFTRVLYNKWYIDEIYDAVIVRPLMRFSDIFVFKLTDTFLIDKILLGLFAVPVKYGAYLWRWVQNGNLQRYTIVFALGVIVVLWMVL